MSAVQKLAALAAALVTQSLAAAEPIDLSPQFDPAGSVQVSAELEVGGETTLPVQSGDEGQAGAVQTFPISVTATLHYEECRLPADSGGAPRAVRYYDRAEAIVKVADGGQSLTLPDDRRLIVAGAAGGRATLCCLDGLMEREQLDLIDAIGDTLFVDRLLPTAPVAEGDTWNQDASTMAGLLCLDSVAVCEVQSILDKHNARFAKVRLEGVVHGVCDGSATQQEVRGVYLFDRQVRRITALNLAVRERRSVGAASRGLQVVSKLRLKIAPSDAPSHLSREVLAAASREEDLAARPLLYDSPEQGFRIEYDRQWFITDHQRESLTMRRVADGDLVAQCTISRLPPKSAGRQTSLEQFEKDVRHSLGERFGQLVSSSQWISSRGHYCYEVVVRGAVQELPVEWHYYLVAPESGHRVTAAVTIEGRMVDRLGRADRDLINRLKLISADSQPAGTAARPPRDATR